MEPRDVVATLTWTAPGDDRNLGQLTAYALRYHDQPIIDEATWAAGVAVSSDPPSMAGTGEQMIVVATSQTSVTLSWTAPGQEVEFSEAGHQFEHLTLRLALGCPNGRCAWWDRTGWISVLEGTGEGRHEIEIARFITPYRLPATWELDVTDLRPVLAGRRTVRVFVDTWVGPGHVNGDGWLVDVEVDFKGGLLTQPAAAGIPVWFPQQRLYVTPTSRSG